MRITPWHKPGHSDRWPIMSGVCYGSGAHVVIPDLPPQVHLDFEMADVSAGCFHMRISMRLDEANDLIRKLQNGITAHAELAAAQEARP